MGFLDPLKRGGLPAGNQRPSKRQCAGIHRVVISHIEQHSKKPDEVRDKIVKLMGDQPRVELFAKTKDSQLWDVWGNGVNCTLTILERKGDFDRAKMQSGCLWNSWTGV